MKPPAFRGKWITLAALLLLLGIAGGAVSVVWKDRHAAAKPVAKAVPAPAGYAGAEVSLAGKIQAKTVQQIAAPITGKIEAFHVEPGAEVYEGQLLAQIRSDALESEQAAAQMALEREQNKVNDLEGAIISARLEASRARADASRARSEFERLSKAYERQRFLLNEGATPRLTYQKAEKEYNTAKSEFENLDAVAKQSEDRLSGIVRDLDAAKKLLMHASEEADNARAHAASGDVHSPVAGIVVGRRGDTGGEVDPSMKNLFEIASDLSQLEVAADATPDVLARVKPGQAAIIRVAELPGEGLGGTVAGVKDGRVIVEFGNPSPLVKPGLSAQVVIKLS